MIRERISPGSSCTFDHNGFYYYGMAIGFGATIVIGGPDATRQTARGLGLTLRTDVTLAGGRSGTLVKGLVGRASSVVKGDEGRIYLTDATG